MPRFSERVRALAHPALTGREDRARAGQLERRRSPRQLQGGASAPRRGRARGRRACAAASPRARGRAPGPSGTPAASRSAPPISSRTPLRSVTQRRIGSGRRAERQRERERLGRLVAEQVAQLRRRALARAQLGDDPRRDAGGARHGVALAGLAAGGRPPRDRARSGAAGARAPPATPAPRSAPIAAAPERRRGHQLGIRRERLVQGAVEPELAHALDGGGRLVLGQQVHQLVAHARARDGRERVLRHGGARGALGVLRPSGSRGAPRSAARAAAAWGRR